MVFAAGRDDDGPMHAPIFASPPSWCSASAAATAALAQATPQGTSAPFPRAAPSSSRLAAPRRQQQRRRRRRRRRRKNAEVDCGAGRYESGIRAMEELLRRNG